MSFYALSTLHLFFVSHIIHGHLTLDVRSRWKMPLLWRYCSPLAMSRERPILTLHDRYMSLSSSCSRFPPLMYCITITMKLITHQSFSPLTHTVKISFQSFFVINVFFCFKIQNSNLTSVRAWSCPSWTHTPKNLTEKGGKREKLKKNEGK